MGSCWYDRLVISIHALREESDPATGGGQYTVKFQSTLSVRRATPDQRESLSRTKRFQSTLSVRRATFSAVVCRPGVAISIHALREESD